jgi:phosphoribosylformimino-5-aminoimidazole carboxamide ribonucleotide (ProFAR) isomerase
VAFDVIPAIDVAGGRLVQMTSGGSEAVDAFGGNPIDAAKAFVADGTAWLHVVDVDRAFSGSLSIEDVLVDIVGMPVRVQVSGGLIRPADISSVLAFGAARVVLGSAALGDRERTAELIEEFGPRLVVAVETDGESIRPRGTAMEIPLEETMWWLAEAGAARYVFVRVAGSKVFDLAGIQALVDATGGPVIASGGITSPEQLASVAALDGVEGAIIGRAFTDGSMTFAAAVRATRGSGG